jgi:hypothetical protein
MMLEIFQHLSGGDIFRLVSVSGIQNLSHQT